MKHWNKDDRALAWGVVFMVAQAVVGIATMDWWLRLL
jgi:hypothetical protein